jgi:pyruvate kinase
MAKRTKIVATLGPATDRPGVVEGILRAGADVLRLNFSHGTAADRDRRVAEARAAAARVGRDIAILGDLQGPKIRVERFAAGPVELVDGEPLRSTPRWLRMRATCTAWESPTRTCPATCAPGTCCC